MFTSCEECEHEGDRSIASSLQVGDVVCSDGSVLSKEKFSSSKKEPVAIVYHVNRNPEIKALGYAVPPCGPSPQNLAQTSDGPPISLFFPEVSILLKGNLKDISFIKIV